MFFLYLHRKGSIHGWPSRLHGQISIIPHLSMPGLLDLVMLPANLGFKWIGSGNGAFPVRRTFASICRGSVIEFSCAVGEPRWLVGSTCSCLANGDIDYSLVKLEPRWMTLPVEAEE